MASASHSQSTKYFWSMVIIMTALCVMTTACVAMFADMHFAHYTLRDILLNIERLWQLSLCVFTLITIFSIGFIQIKSAYEAVMVTKQQLISLTKI